MIGRTIDHYRILAKLGEGGMGVVYRARDTKLDRDVALKFLPAYALTDADVRVRFMREAKSAAQLNHPNIATVFGIGETEPGPEEAGHGRAYIAMELVEGETLSERIKKGPLKLEEVVEIGRQVAEGLQAAHAKGIVHRDVKSSNVMLVSGGGPGSPVRAKILDFGLAMTVASTRLTKTSSTLGTVVYMSPEQARAEVVDRRTDIWSLGVILYEMIAGRLPFAGDYEQAVLYSILNADPEPLTAVRTGVPPVLERVVMKCLEKDRSRRYQHVEEVGVDLGAVPARTTSLSAYRDSRTTLRQSTIGSVSMTIVYMAGWLLFIGLLAVIAIRYIRGRVVAEKAMSTASLILELPLPTALPLVYDPQPSVCWTPVSMDLSADGSNLAYTALREGKSVLVIQPMNGGEAREIRGIRDPCQPVFSPDGRSLAFTSAGQIWTVSIDGAPLTPICEVHLPFGVAWIGSDRLVYADKSGSSLVELTIDGAEKRVIGDVGWWPMALPSGRHVVTVDSRKMRVVDLQTGNSRPIIDDLPDWIGSLKYVPTGHIMYSMRGDIYAVPFDINKLEVTGAPVLIVSDIRMERPLAAGQFAVSDNGVLVYAEVSDGGKARFKWLDENGREEFLPIPAGSYGAFSLSKDSGRLAVSVIAERREVWVYSLASSADPVRLGSSGDDFSPIWAPNGSFVAYLSDQPDGNAWRLWARTPDNSGMPRLVAPAEESQVIVGWGPDGDFAVTSRSDPRTGYDLWMVPMEQGRTSGEARPLDALNTDLPDLDAAFAPDGRRVAVTAMSKGAFNVFIMAYPEGSGREQVSHGSGFNPIWTDDGRTLFFHDFLHGYAVDIADEPPYVLSEPRAVVQGPFLNVGFRSWERGLDGRFLVLQSTETSGDTGRLRVLSNWPSRLAGDVKPAD